MKNKNKIAINWFSNAPWANTGYGEQTRLFVPRLVKEGYDMTMTAFFGLEGAMLNWNGIPVYPKGFHAYGQDVMAAHSNHAGAAFTLSLLDSWVCDPKMMTMTKWVPWFPIDHEPLPEAIREKVMMAFARIVMSRFGARMMDDAGIGDYHYIPHGVDTNIFKPMSRDEARKKAGLPADKFIVGMVAANKGSPSRKAFTQNIAAFARLHSKHPDTVLYLHSSKGLHGEGVNLVEYVESLDLVVGKDVLFVDPYQNLIGFPDEWMNILYNCFDVHLLVSMGEGFGIPILQAQAAGCPVIVGDWTSMSELCFSGWMVDKSEAQPVWTPMSAYQFSPNTGAIVDCLEMAYKEADTKRKAARIGAMEYDADKIVKQYWKPTISKIMERINIVDDFGKAEG